MRDQPTPALPPAAVALAENTKKRAALHRSASIFGEHYLDHETENLHAAINKGLNLKQWSDDAAAGRRSSAQHCRTLDNVLLQSV